MSIKNSYEARYLCRFLFYATLLLLPSSLPPTPSPLAVCLPTTLERRFLLTLFFNADAAALFSEEEAPVTLHYGMIFANWARR